METQQGADHFFKRQLSLAGKVSSGTADAGGRVFAHFSDKIFENGADLLRAFFHVGLLLVISNFISDYRHISSLLSSLFLQRNRDFCVGKSRFLLILLTLVRLITSFNLRHNASAIVVFSEEKAKLLDK